MTQKALLQSAGDGSAVPAGYVGEVLSYIFNTNQTTTATNQISLSDQTISAGRWIVFMSGCWQASNGGTGSTNNTISLRVDGSLRTTNGKGSASIHINTTGPTNVAFPACIDIIEKSSSWSIGVTQNLTFTAGIVASNGSLTLIRIA